MWKLSKILTSIAVAVFWVALWTWGCYVANRSLLMPLPYPWEVLTALWQLLGNAGFWVDVGFSLLRILVGFSVAAVVGILLAVLTSRFRAFHAVFAPLFSIIRAVPVASFIFLAFLWIAADWMPIFISFLMVVPLVWENVRQGIRSTDRDLLEMAQVFRISRSRAFAQIWIPSIRPYLRAALTTSFGFAWKSGIAAEIICTTGNSIGAQISVSKSTLDYASVFACTAVVVLLSLMLEFLLRRVIRKEVTQ